MISINALTVSLTSHLSVHPYNSPPVRLLVSLSPPLPPSLTFNQREEAAVRSTIRQAYMVLPPQKTESKHVGSSSVTSILCSLKYPPYQGMFMWLNMHADARRGGK